MNPKTKGQIYFLMQFPVLMSCIAVCGARYKTRPGLSYHYNHTHKEPGSGTSSSTGTSANAIIPPLEEQEAEGQQTSSSFGGGSLTPPSTPGLQDVLPPDQHLNLPAGAVNLRLIQSLKNRTLRPHY